MVNRIARARAGAIIRDFWDHKLSNDALEDSYPSDPRDPALRAIVNQIWYLYSDLETEYVSADIQSNERIAELVNRILLFLSSDLEYEGPSGSLPGQIYSFMQSVGLGFLLPKRLQRRKFNLGTWPFANTQQLELIRNRSS